VDDVVSRVLTDLVGRLSGPLTLRLFLQPSVATVFAIRDGLRDARSGRPPHFWRLVTGSPEARRRRLRETWRAVMKVFILAILLDCAYQWLVFRWVYPVEAIITAVVLAFVPYVAIRGIVNRLAPGPRQTDRMASS
jgi:drug/metabolite transporter (DMT)-like permease